MPFIPVGGSQMMNTMPVGYGQPWGQNTNAPGAMALAEALRTGAGATGGGGGGNQQANNQMAQGLASWLGPGTQQGGPSVTSLMGLGGNGSIFGNDLSQYYTPSSPAQFSMTGSAPSLFTMPG